jgi:coenzyme F420-0:L-glutamate ligase/coenzyme F420-1:gamma-L-glutamate ligase
MSARRLTLQGLEGLPLISPGDDLAALLAGAMRRMEITPEDGDVVVVAQKIVSKAEGRLVELDGITPSPRARDLAQEVGKDARLVEVILRESTEVVRHKKDVLIVAHRLGFVMANAGVDQSNVGADSCSRVLLLPCAPDASAARLKQRLDQEFDVDLGIVINDSFGRPWRNGVVGVALGAAGVPSLWNRVGSPDLFGRPMRVTEVAVADQVASAASLVMGEADEGLPAVHVRGIGCVATPVPASALVRPREMDLFR